VQNLIAELTKRFGLWAILALILAGALVWVIAHSQAKPGEKVSILWGMVEYTKGKSQPGLESTYTKKHRPTITRPPTTTSRPASISIVETNDITFDLQECRMSGRNITCYLLITSKIDVAFGEFMIHIKGDFASKIVDYSGKEYFASLVKLGNKSHNRSVEDGLYSNIIPRPRPWPRPGFISL